MAQSPDVADLWEKIKRQVKGRDGLNFPRGASVNELAELETLVGHKLPADFVASYQTVNGDPTSGDGFIPGELALSGTTNVLLPIKQIQDDWTMLKELLDMGEFAGEKTTPDPGVQNQWWSAGWVPFVSDGGGNYLCVDLTPADGGTIGQVLCFSHDSGNRKLIARSVAEFLEKLLAAQANE